MSKKFCYILCGIFCTILIGLQIQSSAWFRLKVIDNNIEKGRIIAAIEGYRKILTKNNAKKRLSKETLFSVHMNLGHRYAQLKLINLAIESYANAGMISSNIKAHNYLSNGDSYQNKLLAIGLLEAGQFDNAIIEFKRIKDSYQDIDKYINTVNYLKKNVPAGDNGNRIFLIGDAYIKNNLFDEARDFFTKRILSYGARPIRVLEYINKRYSKTAEIKTKIWGDSLYIVIEDFEDIDTQLSRWIGTANPNVNTHSIVKTPVYKGMYSEFLDLSYVDKGYEFWEKSLKIPIDKTNLNLGIRLFINSVKPTIHDFVLYMNYSEQGKTGGLYASDSKDIGFRWREYNIENIHEYAKKIASRHGWTTKGMAIDKIIIDTKAVSGKFYVDSVELYVMG